MEANADFVADQFGYALEIPDGKLIAATDGRIAGGWSRRHYLHPKGYWSAPVPLTAALIWDAWAFAAIAMEISFLKRARYAFGTLRVRELAGR